MQWFRWSGHKAETVRCADPTILQPLPRCVCPLSDAMRRMPLLPRGLSVYLQNPVNESRYSGHLHLGSFCLLPSRRRRAPHRFAHHPPVHPQLPRYPDNRPCAKLILTPDLLV